MRYRIPPRLAYVVEEGDAGPEVFLMRLPDGVPVHLAGTSAVIWLLAAEGSDVVESLAELVAAPPPDLPRATAAFLDDLVGSGLLAVKEDPDER